MVKIFKNRVNGLKVRGKLKQSLAFYVPARPDLFEGPGFLFFSGNDKKIDSDNAIGVYFFNYFVGIAANVAFKNSQNLLTDSMFTFSSGE